MKKDISPEEKLLHLIRGQKTGDAQKPAMHPGQWLRRHFTASLLRNCSAGLFLLSLVYLAYVLVYPYTNAGKIKLPEQGKQKKSLSSVSPLPEETRPLEFYTQALKEDRLFGSMPAGQAQLPAAATAEALKDISLVGIVSGEPGQAVIEDKQAQRTYYVTKGQSVAEYQVEDIQEGKIILNRNGQKYELYI